MYIKIFNLFFLFYTKKDIFRTIKVFKIIKRGFIIDKQILKIEI